MVKTALKQDGKDGPAARGDFSSMLKYHHKLVGLKLIRAKDNRLALINPWGTVVKYFSLECLSPHPVWEAADQEIARGCLCHGN